MAQIESEDKPFQTNREIISKILTNQEKMLSDSFSTNMELARISNHVKDLVSDNIDNKKAIKNNERFTWTAAAIFSTVIAFKEFIINK